MTAYDQSYCGPSAYASHPLPCYLEKLDIGDVTDDVRDVCYHLIKLYCDRTHPLHILLNTAAITDNPLDYSLRFVGPRDGLLFTYLFLLQHVAFCQLCLFASRRFIRNQSFSDSTGSIIESDEILLLCHCHRGALSDVAIHPSVGSAWAS